MTKATLDRQLQILDIIESLMRHGWTYRAALAAAPSISMLSPKDGGTLEIVYGDGVTESPTTTTRPPESERQSAEVTQLTLVPRKVA
jgi:hypothetical protein